MMRSTFAARLFLLSMLIGSLDASTASAAEAPLALVAAGHNQLEWTPLGDFESITLALADTQGLVRTHRFGPREAPVLSLFDAQGMPLPDGTYTWELRVTPPRSAGRPSARLVQSGYFTIANGGLVAPDLSDLPECPKVIASEDQMVPDDLIVDGKGCIGLGCANNETFFAEALRLKQSVVRLRFEDTSTTAGLPTRDWQLTVNDAASGGADRFSIDDLTAGTTPFTVRGGAPSNSLYLDGAGNVGLGTATPANKLHVSRSVGGSVAVALIEETNGTTAFRTMLELKNNGGSRLNLTDTLAGATWGINNNFGALNMIKSGTGGILAFSLQGNGNLTIAGTLTQSSDRTTKTDIQPVDPRRVLAKTAELPISTWRRIGDTSAHLGPMAQDFRAAFGLGEDDRHIAPGDLAGVSLAAIQGLHTLVEEQRQLIEKQQELIGRLEERLQRLEAQEQPDLKSVVQP